METNLITLIMRGNNVKDACEKMRMSEDELTELWYECGLAFIARTKKAIQNKTHFDNQFNTLRGNVKFDSLTPSEVFDRIEQSKHFWNWWLNCLVGICARINATPVTRQNSARLHMLRMFAEFSYIPEFVILKIFDIENERKTFKIRGIKEAYSQERPVIQSAT